MGSTMEAKPMPWSKVEPATTPLSIVWTLGHTWRVSYLVIATVCQSLLSIDPSSRPTGMYDLVVSPRG